MLILDVLYASWKVLSTWGSGSYVTYYCLWYNWRWVLATHHGFLCHFSFVAALDLSNGQWQAIFLGSFGEYVYHLLVFWLELLLLVCMCFQFFYWLLLHGLLWRCWGYLLCYAGINIILLYVYQLPLEFCAMYQWFADLIGLYKLSPKSDWPEICSGFSIILFYFMVSFLHLIFQTIQ